MDRRIIIIHPSAIIRKGLHSILRDSFPDDFLLLKSVKDLDDYSSLTSLQLIVLIDNDQLQDLEAYKPRIKKSENTIDLLGLSLKESDGNKQINVFDSVSEIIHKVKSTIESQEKKGCVIDDLSDREKDVLKLVALGHQNKEIAEKLFISIHTVISHRKNITEKLGIKSISGLTVYAILNKLIDTKNIDPSTLI